MKLLKILFLVTFSLFSFFVFGEMAARVFYRPVKNSLHTENRKTRALKDRFDPFLGWVHIANTKIQRKMPGYVVEYEINSKGLRSETDYPYEKPEGQNRIIIIGDSFTFGHGVKNQDTYASKLEGKLNHTEVINMGVSGYSTAQQYLFLRTEGMKYNPELVIVGLYITNIRRNLDSIARPRFKLIKDSLVLINSPLHQGDSLTVSDNDDEIPTSTNFFVLHSRFVQFLYDKTYYIKKRLNPLPEYEDGSEGWALLRSLLLEIRRTAAVKGAKTLIVLIPHHSYYGGQMSQYVSRRPFEQMKKFAAENDYYFIDLLPLFERYSAEKNWTDLIIAGDGHWNEKGHELAASEIYNYILKNKILN